MFEPAAYTQLQPGDRIKLPRMYGDALVDWWWPILTINRIDWIRDDHTALMLRLTHPLPCGDRFVLIAGHRMINAGVQRLTRPDHSDRQRLLNQWNAARHGWHRFQTGNRRAAERIAFADPTTDLNTPTSSPTSAAR